MESSTLQPSRVKWDLHHIKFSNSIFKRLEMLTKLNVILQSQVFPINFIIIFITQNRILLSVDFITYKNSIKNC